MEHKGTFYSIDYGANGWAVWIGLRYVCDGFDTRAEAIEWIKRR